MRCIFCKSVSDTSISIAHIFSESNGNTEHVPPRGWDCDACNNYFVREVEKSFLDSDYGRHSRFEMTVENKRGRVSQNEHTWNVPAAELLANGCNLDRKNPRAKEDITRLPSAQLATDILKKEHRIAEIMGKIQELLAK